MSTRAWHIFCNCWLLSTCAASHHSGSCVLEELRCCQARENWLLADYRLVRHHKLPDPQPHWAQKQHSWVWETLISPPAVANTKCFRETKHPLWVNTPEFTVIRWTKTTAKSRLCDSSKESKVYEFTLFWNLLQQYQVWKELLPCGGNIRENLPHSVIHRYICKDKDFVHFIEWWLTAANPTWIFIWATHLSSL